MSNPIPSLLEIGVIERDIPYKQEAARLAQDNYEVAFDMALAIQSPTYAQLEDEAVIKAMNAAPDRQVDLGDDLESDRYETYLDAAYEEYKEREGEDALSLRDYEHGRIRAYKLHRYGEDGDRDAVKSLSITQGFVAELATDSARRNKYDARRAADLVFLKHLHRNNIARLEAELSETDLETYANLRRPQEISLLTDQYEGDPEGLELYRKARFLIEAFKKRQVIRQLAAIFGTEVSADFSRDDVEDLAELVEEHGEDITK